VRADHELRQAQARDSDRMMEQVAALARLMKAAEVHLARQAPDH